MTIKSQLDKTENPPNFNEGEIWWCGIGKNVGTEINGKSGKFSRPVYILKKLSNDSAYVLPLTSRHKTGSWYVKITCLNRKSSLVLSQLKTISAKRLYERITRLPKSTQLKIKNATTNFIKSQ